MPADHPWDMVVKAVNSGVFVTLDDGSVEVNSDVAARWHPYLQLAGVTDEVVEILKQPPKVVDGGAADEFVGIRRFGSHSIVVPDEDGSVDYGGMVTGEAAEAIRKVLALKAIREHWNEAGAHMSAYGLPVGSEIEVYSIGNGYQADFRSGSMRTLSGNGTIVEDVPGDWVRIHRVGLECGVRQEAADEVYGTVMCQAASRSATPTVVPFPGGNQTYKMGEPGARMVLTNSLLYEGPLANLNIGAILIENDSGDVEEISAAVTAKVAALGAAAIGAATGAPAEAISSQTWYMEGVGAVVGLVLDDVFGIGDDPYPPTNQLITWQELATWPAAKSYSRPGEPLTINAYNVTRDVAGTDDGGDLGHYRFYYLAEHMNAPIAPG